MLYSEEKVERNFKEKKMNDFLFAAQRASQGW